MFLKIISKIMGNNRGYVAIILAVFIPLALSLFYLYISYSSVSSLRTQANIASRDAAIAVASNYANKAFFGTDDLNKALERQKDYLTRKAVLAFNATMKSNLGINKNAIPVTKKNIYYGFDTTSYGKRWVDNTWDSLSGKCCTYIYDYLPNNGSLYDPEFPQYLEGFPGKGLYTKTTSDPGKTGLTKVCYVPNRSSTNYIKLSNAGSSNADSNKIKVETSITAATKGRSLKNQQTTYKSVYYAEPASCEADIILAIPMNRAAFTVTNTNSDDVVGFPDDSSNKVDSTDSVVESYKCTPIYEMKKSLERFVKRFMFYDKLRIGLIPYSGKISEGNQLGVYGYRECWPLFTQPEGTLPTIPISDSYKTCGISGESITNANNKDKTYFRSRSSFKAGLGIMAQKNILQSISSSNRLRNQPVLLCYGGNISSYSMRCKIGSFYYSLPYYVEFPNYNTYYVYEKLKTYGSFNPHSILGQVDQGDFSSSFDNISQDGNMSNFLFLPFMWGDYLLNESWAGALKDRKKFMIILANGEDFFAPGELTYLGFDNDASHVSMIEGERMDYANNLNLVCSKGYNADSEELGDTTKNYISNTRLHLDNYNGQVVTNDTFDLKIPEAQNCRIAVKNGVTVRRVSACEHAMPDSGGVVLCDKNIGNRRNLIADKDIEVADQEVIYVNYYHNFRGTPVLAKFKATGVQLEVIKSNNYKLVSDGEYVYLCYKEVPPYRSDYSTAYIQIKTLNDGEVAKYPRLSYYTDNNNTSYLLTEEKTISDLPSISSKCFKKYNAEMTYNYTKIEEKEIWNSYGKGDAAISIGTPETSAVFTYYTGGQVLRNISKVTYNISFSWSTDSVWKKESSRGDAVIWKPDSVQLDRSPKGITVYLSEGIIGFYFKLSKVNWFSVYNYVLKCENNFNNAMSGDTIKCVVDNLGNIIKSGSGTVMLNDIKFYSKESTDHSCTCKNSNCSDSIENHINSKTPMSGSNTNFQLSSISVKPSNSSIVTFSTNNSVSLTCDGKNLIKQNSRFVNSVNVSGCKVFYIDKSWLGSGAKTIKIGLKGCKILSIDVSNNITCWQKDVCSCFNFEENNLDKIVAELDLTQKNNNSCEFASNKSTDPKAASVLKFSGSNLKYDDTNRCWRTDLNNGDSGTATITLDSEMYDKDQGIVSISVAPVKKYIEDNHNHSYPFKSGLGGQYEIYYNSGFSKKKLDSTLFTTNTTFTPVGCTIEEYRIYDYKKELATLGQMPSFHVRIWTPKVWWNSKTHEDKKTYPKNLAKCLKNLSDCTFDYKVVMKKTWAGSCLIKCQAKIKDYYGGNDLVSLYDTGYCWINSTHYGSGKLGYPYFYARSYTGSNNQSPQFTYTIENGHTNKHDYLLCSQNPFENDAEGTGKFSLVVNLVPSTLENFETKKEPVSCASQYTRMVKNNPNSKKNVYNITLNSLYITKVRYEGRNPIMYDRPTAPSKNARWIDFSAYQKKGGDTIPVLDNGIYDSFSGEVVRDYDQALAVAKANYDTAKKNLATVGIPACGSLLKNDSEIKIPEGENNYSLSGSNCVNCENEGFANPCTEVELDDTVCSSKSYEDWKTAKKKYAEKYKEYIEIAAKLMGLSVKLNSSWNIDTDPVIGAKDADILNGDTKSSDGKNGYLTIEKSDEKLYDLYNEYTKFKEYYTNLYSKGQCGTSDAIGSDDTSDLDLVDKDSLPQSCKDCVDSSAKDIDREKFQICLERLAEKVSNLKIEYYSKLDELRPYVTTLENAETTLSNAEKTLNDHLEKGNGVFLNFWNEATPKLGSTSSHKENSKLYSSPKETEYWIGTTQEKTYKNVEYTERETKTVTKMETISGNSGKQLNDAEINLKKQYDSCSCGEQQTMGTLVTWKVCSCSKTVTEDVTKTRTEERIVDKEFFIYPDKINRNVASKDSRFLYGVLPAQEVIYNTDYKYGFRDSDRGKEYYRKKCNGGVSDRDYLIGSVICANQYNSIEEVTIKEGKKKLKTPFTPEGYFNPCYKKYGDTSSICPDLCQGDVKSYNDAISTAETEVSTAEKALDEKYTKLEEKLNDAKTALDNEYNNFIKKGVTLSVETYTSDGKVAKYYASCSDGEDNPATKVYQQKTIACPEKCQKWKENFATLLSAYNDALSEYNAAKISKEQYDDLKVKQSADLVYEKGFFRTGKADADIALYTLAHTGDLSLYLENYYNQNNNIIQYALAKDTERKSLLQLTGLQGVFVPYNTKDNFDIEDLLKKDEDVEKYHTLTGYAMRIKGGNTRLAFAEFTLPINTILSADYWGADKQQVITKNGITTVNKTPTQMIKTVVLPKIIEQAKKRLKGNGKIYFIAYRWPAETINYVENYKDSTLKCYKVGDAQTLDKTLIEISQEIESMSNAQSIKVYSNP